MQQQSRLLKVKPRVPPPQPSGRLQGLALAVVTGGGGLFDRLVMGIILCNTLMLCVQYADAPPALQLLLGYGNLCFSAAFTVEAALRILALGPRAYLSKKSNVFDLSVTAVGVADVLLSSLVASACSGGGQQSASSSSLMQVIRALRVFRLIRLIR